MIDQKLVLVVDDDEDTRNLLTSMLTRQGLTVDTAAEGGAALQLLEQRTYSVILLDLLMPGVDGFTLLERIHRSAVAMPVVLVMTDADRSVVDRLDAKGIHGVVRKPFDPEELAVLVVACADIKSRGAFGTMAIATMIAGGPFLELLNRLAK